MIFEPLEDVRLFAGEDYEHANEIPKAQALLSRFDDSPQHYEIREEINY